MRRLYQKIYLTMIGALVLLVLVAGAIWRFGPGGPPVGQAFELAGELAAVALPPADAPQVAQQDALMELGRRLRLDMALYDTRQRPIAAVGGPLPPPDRSRDTGLVYGPGGPAWMFRLPDDRILVARPPPRHRSPVLALMVALGLIAVVVAVAAFPVVRGLTRRLETLQAGVETLGAGHLAARVPVEGRDEVARLAESFNRAAGRIEELVGAHRLLLANASHELRTPLARIRLGVELMKTRPDPRHSADIERDIAELDGLIDEILLASRLDAIGAPQATEEVDLLALAAEECARYDCTLDGAPVVLAGDPRLLRRMIRNLLENAERHGAPPVRVGLAAERGRAVLTVADGGPGVPPGQQEQVFTPFFRLAGDSRGAGLGLALVRQIARLHGGDATVAPQPDAPSCFRVALPLVRV
ncbi:ATP-binding protein [Rhodoplanes sp. TEM]|uniref:histidine kinase n=1 Tax=Rhodoplanes tepidamans TaxID=200616 RepID=A0ABT5J4I8_RHOTP|nr:MULTISPECIES: ATP-binding protein [Rhodoplanes]MDC7784558.1 ATP-binding protein [Rhodoplanes tepidamans]MDC7984465.1 ATP-binding protein [Rhodoplanes sp. TEM]MDQ0355786.1 signal transduction histidine kinase [Rhodoplanes tepidamans]